MICTAIVGVSTRGLLRLTISPAAPAGIKDGIEGNYISTADDLVLADSPEGLATLAAMTLRHGHWWVTEG